MSKGKILFQLSGSIACFKACALISRLVQAGYEVETVATRSALEFVGRATLEGLTGRATHTDVFEPGRYMDHIHLARWADLTLLCPATANSIAKLANGLGDDLVSTLFLAHEFKTPYLVIPAMNVAMYRHSATQKNLETVRAMGVQVLETADGRLACGEIGEGRMLEPDAIFAAIERELGATERVKAAKKILITAGGTREAIDGVRSLTNLSTGKTGKTIADHFTARGHDVVFLHATDSARPERAGSNLRLRSFSDFNSLRDGLASELDSQRFDAVIHAAAVSDYSISSIQSAGRSWTAPVAGKIDSGEDMTLKLERNPKLIDSIRSSSKNKNTRLVAFKLTNTKDASERQSAISHLAAHAHPDLIVHNDASEIDRDHHPFSVWKTTRGVPVSDSAVDGAKALAERIDHWLENEPGGLA